MTSHSAVPKGRDLITAAIAAFQANDFLAAGAHLRDLVDENPPLGDTWGSVARLASILGEASVAVTAARRFARESPGDRDRRLTAGAIMAQHERVEEAMGEVSAILPQYPHDPTLLHFLGTCEAQLGNNEAAQAALRASLANQRTAAAALTWLALVDLKTFKPGDPDLEQLHRLVVALNGVEEMQGAALYAMAKVRNDIGDTDGAFEAIKHGAALIGRLRPYDSKSASAFVDQMINGADADHQASLPASAIDSDRPIFVLGAPRSGSTLVEQMLVSHPAVTGGSELGLFRHAATALAAMAPEDQKRAAFDPGAKTLWEAIGRTYLHLLDERYGREGRIVDKTLNHTQIVGLIASILPKARFIWLKRDPAAVAWSCLKTHFNEGQDWSWSQAQIAVHLRDEDRLHAHWTGLFPDAILTVPYERLVTDPESWIPRILSHCGLADDPAVRVFHKTRRAVRTASVSQVREPLHTRAIEDWRRYERHLQPFLRAYMQG